MPLLVVAILNFNSFTIKYEKIHLRRVPLFELVLVYGLLLHTGSHDRFGIQISAAHALSTKHTTLRTKKSFCVPHGIAIVCCFQTVSTRVTKYFLWKIKAKQLSANVLRSSHIKALFEAVCFLCVAGSFSHSSPPPRWNVFLVIACIYCLAKP